MILDVTHGRVRWIADAVPVGWRGIVVVVVVVVDGREIVVVVVIDGCEIVVVVVIDGREIVVVVAALLGCVGWPVFVSGVARKVVWVGTHGDKVGPLQYDGSIFFILCFFFHILPTYPDVPNAFHDSNTHHTNQSLENDHAFIEVILVIMLWYVAQGFLLYEADTASSVYREIGLHCSKREHFSRSQQTKALVHL